MTGAAFGNPHGFIEIGNLLPAPCFLEDHLQDADFAVEQVWAGFLAALGLITAYVGYRDVPQQDLAEEWAEHLQGTDVVSCSVWLDIPAVLLDHKADAADKGIEDKGD